MSIKSESTSEQVRPVIRISDKFIETVAMPKFEKGLEQGEERAFALLGTINRDRDRDRIEVKDGVEVPEKFCSDVSFEPLPTEFEEMVKDKAEKKRLNVLGYLHNHNTTGRGHNFFKPLLSKTDWKQMVKKKEVVRGICVLPVEDWKEGQIEIPSINAALVFWNRGYCAPLPVRCGPSNSPYGIYCQWGGEKGNWVVLPVESG